jgi:ribosomal protein L11 methyltransferase
MALYEIKVEVAAANADEIDNVLLELGVDRWSLHEDAIGKRAWVIGVFSDEAQARDHWNELRPRLPGAPPVLPELRLLADCDWRDSYKAHFKAWQFDHLHWVPVWERASFKVPPGSEVLWLDPGLAFGTGNHETTRLCVERLVALGRAKGVNDRVIDAGCGSGILALSAALLGFRDIVAFDSDPEAIRVSHENAALNDLAGRVKFFGGDLTTGLAGQAAGVLLANIQADVLMRFAGELIAAIAPGGTLVLSGILADELDKVRAVFLEAAPEWVSDSRILGEWSDLVLCRPLS